MRRIFSLIALFPMFASAQQVAITIDDFGIKDRPLLNIEQRDQRILDVLAKHKIKAGVFVTTNALRNPRVKARLKKWDEAGHLIGNHTHSHMNYHKVSYEKFSIDVSRADQILGKYHNFVKLFRFPMINLGRTKLKRDSMRTFLRDQGYTHGYVSIDASDWYINSRLGKRLMRNPRADLAPYRDFFKDHIWSRAQYYEGLAKRHLRRSVKHTLVVHHNLLNALFLDDIIRMFIEKKWKIISASEAFTDPIYKLEPDVLPAGESILWSVAKSRGDKSLRYPGEDSTYEKAEADRRGL